jgi:small subunit ribosomal protein S5
MEETKKPVVGQPAEVKVAPEAKAPIAAGVATHVVPGHVNGNPSYEPHGSQSASRPGDRKGAGGHQSRPGERRGGRGGFRRDEDEYQDRVVDINRICRVEMGGKHVRFDALVVIGDGKGHYGFALCKSGEVPDAIKKSLAAAKKELFTLHIAKGNTLSHEVMGTFADTKVFLKPAPAGTGIIAGGAVRAILELAGIKNVYSKVYGSRTPINVIRATHAGLQSMKEYEKIMILRGLKTPEEIKALHPSPKAPAPAQAPVQASVQAPAHVVAQPVVSAVKPVAPVEKPVAKAVEAAKPQGDK